MNRNKSVLRFFALAFVFTAAGCGGSADLNSENTIDNNGKASFSLNVDSLELSIGEAFSLFPPSYASDEGLTWHSSDPSIVSVDQEGELMAVDLGSAVVYAFDSRAIASVSVAVTNASSKYSFELSFYSITLGKGEDYSCRVLARITQDGEAVEGQKIEVEKKEESVEGVAKFEKDGEAYRFTGLKEGNAIYSFSAVVEERRIGRNLLVTVIGLE